MIKAFLERQPIRYKLPVFFFVVAWAWLFQVDAAKLSKNVIVGFGLITIIYLILVSVSSLIALLAISRLNKLVRYPSWRSIVIIICGWAFTEFVIAWIFTLLWFGRGTSWDDLLPFGSIAPFLAYTPLAYLLRAFGYFGSSAIIGTGILLVFLGKKWRNLVLEYWVIIIVINVFCYVFFRTANGSIIKTRIVAEQLGVEKRVDPETSKLVILPEYGLDDIDNNNLSSRIASSKNDIYFSGTKLVNKDDGYRNVLVYGSLRDGFLRQYEKSRLIVGGEYLSYAVEYGLKYTARSVYDNFKFTREVVKGDERLSPFYINPDLVLGNAACSSIISPKDYRSLSMQGATILANSASLEIFRGSKLFDVYHGGLARFMAIANARPFVQSANNWQAFALDHNGNLLKRVDIGGTASVEIMTNSRKTPYTYLGEWLVWLGSLIFIIYLFRYMHGLNRHKLQKE